MLPVKGFKYQKGNLAVAIMLTQLSLVSINICERKRPDFEINQLFPYRGKHQSLVFMRKGRTHLPCSSLVLVSPICLVALSRDDSRKLELRAEEEEK